MRAHIVVPDTLIAEVDARVGQRKRSRFIAEAIAEKLRRVELLDAYDAFAGSLADVDIPGWETPESTTEWVRALRQGSDRVPALWGEQPTTELPERPADQPGAA